MAMVYVISILKLAPLILLIFVGFPHIEWAGVAGADIPGTETLGQSMLVLMYAFIGFEFSLIAAGETRNARPAIPRTLVGTVVAISVAYTLIQLVIVSVGYDLGTSEAPLVDVPKRPLGRSEERRGGTGCVCTCRSRLSPCH